MKELKRGMWQKALRIVITVVAVVSFTFLVITQKGNNFLGKQEDLPQTVITTGCKILLSRNVSYAEQISIAIQKEKKETKYVSEPYIVEATAYNATGSRCADGTWPAEGETLAGRKSWIGRSCNLYYVAKDGSIGEKIGTYKFHDTGFGSDPDGDGKGSIQTGERIDVFMNSYSNAINWGIRNVYIEFLD